MVNNYYFDKSHKLRPFVKTLFANPKSFPPENALRIAPPENIPKGYWPAEKNGGWTLIEDHREEIGYLNGELTEIKDFGPLPEGWSEEPPKIEISKEAVLKDALYELDLQSIRPLRALQKGTGTQEDEEKISQIEEKIEQIRKELAELGEKDG